MCGLVGIFDTRGAGEIDRELLGRMNASQFHRGPDEGGLHVEPGVGLGHRRLSIIDLSNGQQPLFNEDHSVVVVYNGEIYNFQELAEELKASGHTFRTHCDTEVIVHAWEEWGEACVGRLRGMFAFALWDRNRSRLFLARDRLGIKPVYYASLPNGLLIFSSELKALYVHPALSRELDDSAIEDYFALGYVPDPKTILKQARKLPPAHTLSWDRGATEPRIREYWDVPFVQVEDQDPEELQVELIERLREAVDIRMIAEVPLGAFLSGGVDSSAVVAMMAGLSDQPVKTCSISFGDPSFNEAEYASAVAKRYGTDHQTFQVMSDDFDLVDRLAGLYDEPFADSSALPTYRVCELARRQVVVALSGDGGDENFAGYRRYRWHMKEESIRSVLPSGIRRPLFGIAGRLYPRLKHAPRAFRLKATLQSLALSSTEAYLQNSAVVSAAHRRELFSKRFKKKLAGYSANEVMESHAARAPCDDALSLVQYLDMKTYLPGDILTKVDRASMAHSLEVRVPILDHQFVEWSSGISPESKLVAGEGKHIFKRALESYLPKDILYRPKMGFAVPLEAWFRGALRERVRNAVLGDVLAESELFDRTYLERIVREHQAGRVDHSAKLWSLMMFDAFYRRVVAGEARESDAV